MEMPDSWVLLGELNFKENERNVMKYSIVQVDAYSEDGHAFPFEHFFLSKLFHF